MKKAIALLLICSLFIFGFTNHINNRVDITTMANCGGKDIEVEFNIPLAKAAKKLGYKVASTVKDTGTALIYLHKLDVYYLTKRDSKSIRYDGELFVYKNHRCLE